VINVPLPATTPPQEPVYHCQLDAPFRFPDKTLSVTEPPAQIVSRVASSTGLLAATPLDPVAATVTEVAVAPPPLIIMFPLYD
jgi:hypothetical protein